MYLFLKTQFKKQVVCDFWSACAALCGFRLPDGEWCDNTTHTPARLSRGRPALPLDDNVINNIISNFTMHSMTDGQL